MDVCTGYVLSIESLYVIKVMVAIIGTMGQDGCVYWLCFVN